MRALVLEILLWLLGALGGVALCVGLWDCWLSGHISLLVLGSAMLGLVMLTRRWARPDRPAGTALFAAIVLCTPAIAVCAYGGLVILLTVALGPVIGYDSAPRLFQASSIVGAAAIVALFVRTVIRNDCART